MPGRGAHEIQEPRAGMSGYSCNKVSTDFSSVVGETEGEVMLISNSLTSSVEFTVGSVNSVPRDIST